MRTYSHNIDLARTIVGIVGNVLSLCLFISPAPTFRRVLKNKSVEEFDFYPYIASIMNCALWVFYGLPFIHPHSPLVISINGLGLIIEIIYIGIYFYYAEKKSRWWITGLLTAEACFVGGLAAIAIPVFHTYDARSTFVGAFSTVFAIIMYGSPLLVMKKVIKTKSVEFMPFNLTLAGFLNGCCWTTYALIEFDLYLLIANGVGGLLTVAQLILYAMYYKKEPVKDEKPTQVQLSTTV